MESDSMLDKIKKIRDNMAEAKPVVTPPREVSPRPVTAKKVKRTKPGYDTWMDDVREAVDYFIGMDLEVLPEVPWEKWHAQGLSATKAAKMAVQIHEDSEGDDSPEDDLAWGEDSAIGEAVGSSRIPYNKWMKKVSEAMEAYGVDLGSFMKRRKLAGSAFLKHYNEEYTWRGMVSAILEKQAFPPRKRRSGKPMEVTEREEINSNLNEIAEELGINFDRKSGQLRRKRVSDATSSASPGKGE